jgi:transposase-like protein
MGKRKFTPEFKLALVKRHLVGGEPAYKLAAEAGIDKSSFHRWQRRFLLFSFRYGEDAFRRRARYDRSNPLWELDALLGKLLKAL